MTTELSYLRTPRGTAIPYENEWGTNLILVEDPDAVYSNDILNSFLLADNIDKIPASLWNRVANLFKHYATDNLNLGTLEATVGFYYNLESKEWRCLVPKQAVSSGQVEYDYRQARDIVSGEIVPESDLLNAGFSFLGRCHSHHKMTLDRPSTIDDSQEIPVSQVCILVSCMNLVDDMYRITITVTRPYDSRVKINKRYFNNPETNSLHWSKLIEVGEDNIPENEEFPLDVFFSLDNRPESTYHSEVLQQISLWTPPAVKSTVSVGWSQQKSTNKVAHKYLLPAGSPTLTDFRTMVEKFYCENFNVSMQDLTSIVEEVYLLDAINETVE